MQVYIGIFFKQVKILWMFLRAVKEDATLVMEFYRLWKAMWWVLNVLITKECINMGCEYTSLALICYPIYSHQSQSLLTYVVVFL